MKTKHKNGFFTSPDVDRMERAWRVGDLKTSTNHLISFPFKLFIIKSLILCEPVDHYRAPFNAAMMAYNYHNYKHFATEAVV